jgi:hypothetical protein
METLKDKAEALARDAGMQFDSRYSHWVSARGQFEGQQWYAPYYWECALNGDGETLWSDEGVVCDITADLFTVDGDESETFDLKCGSWILVRQDSNGFVMVTHHDTREGAEFAFRGWIGL